MKIGLIGGTGLEDCPFGEINNKNVQFTFISRHGRYHSISPSNVDYIGNIHELYEFNCDLIIAFTACGSLKEELFPGMFVLPDQFIDFTYKRNNAPNRIKNVVHTPMADPFDKKYADMLYYIMKQKNFFAHLGGTVITIEGPRFSTRAESFMYKQWGADIINMTTATECAVANEFGIPYVSVAMVTDYDCWKLDHESVSMDVIKKVMEENKEKAITLIKEFADKI